MMQRVALSLLLIAVCASAVEVCFPEVFTVEEVAYDPTKHDRFGIRTHFSFPLKKERIDVNYIVENDQPIHERIELLVEGAQQIYYKIVFDEKGDANCTKHSIQSKFEKPCLSKNAKHRGTVVLGGTLTCDNYVEILHDQKGDRIFLDMLAVDNINVPVRMTTRLASDFRVHEYWNFHEKVNHEAFNIPSACKNTELTSPSESEVAILNRFSTLAAQL